MNEDVWLFLYKLSHGVQRRTTSEVGMDTEKLGENYESARSFDLHRAKVARWVELYMLLIGLILGGDRVCIVAEDRTYSGRCRNGGCIVAFACGFSKAHSKMG